MIQVVIGRTVKSSGRFPPVKQFSSWLETAQQSPQAEAKLQLKRRKLGLGLSSALPAEREESIYPVPEFSELEARTSFFSSLYYYF